MTVKFKKGFFIIVYCHTVNKDRLKSLHIIPEMKKYKIVAPSLKLLNLKDISSYLTPQFTSLIMPYK